MTHIPTPAAAPLKDLLPTDKMDVRALWEVYKSSPPVRRAPPPLPLHVRLQALRVAPPIIRMKEETVRAGREVGDAARRALAWTRHTSAAFAGTVRPKMRAVTAPRVSLLTLGLVLLASWGGAFAVGIGGRRTTAPPAGIVAAPPVIIPAAPPIPHIDDLPTTMELPADPPAPTTTPAPPPGPAHATPKTASDADLAAAQRASAASRAQLDSSLK